MSEQPHSLVRDIRDPSPSKVFGIWRKLENGQTEEHKFRVRILRLSETIEALKAAQAYAKEKGELQEYGDIYKEAQAIELLQRSLCHVEIGERNGRRFLRPVFVSSEQLRDSLDENECAQLVACYQVTKAYFGITDELHFSDEKLNQYIDRLTDEMVGPAFLSRVDSSDWAPLIFNLARLAQSWRPPESPTRSGSPSSSESPLSTSESGTTGFSQLPVARLTESPNSEPLPTDRVLSADEAHEFVRRNPED